MKIKGFNFLNVELEILPSKKELDDYSKNTTVIDDLKPSDNFLGSGCKPLISNMLDKEQFLKELREIEDSVYISHPSEERYYKSRYFKDDIEQLIQELESEGLPINIEVLN